MTSGNIPMCCGCAPAKPMTVRFVEPRDAEALQDYFRSLSTRSRYNRFLGAISELPPACSIASSMSARPTASAWSRS